MKYLALIASVRATIHADCTMTWRDAGDPACNGDGEICFDWQNEAKDQSLGLKCGLKSDCNTTFKYEGGGDTMFYAQCEGLSLSGCFQKDNYDQKDEDCDQVGGFKCAEWVSNDDSTDGSTDGWFCAAPKECGTSVQDLHVACTGIYGDECKTNMDCDSVANRCAMGFNHYTREFEKEVLNHTATCIGKVACDTDYVDRSTNVTYLCYNDQNEKCEINNNTCYPYGTNGEIDVVCGMFAVDGTNMTSGMCVNKKMCPASALNGTGATVQYFGADAMLWCDQSARTALAMGAAAISAYLAM